MRLNAKPKWIPPAGGWEAYSNVYKALRGYDKEIVGNHNMKYKSCIEDGSNRKGLDKLERGRSEAGMDLEVEIAFNDYDWDV